MWPIRSHRWPEWRVIRRWAGALSALLCAWAVGCSNLYSPGAGRAELCNALESAVVRAPDSQSRHRAEKKFASECVNKTTADEERQRKPSTGPPGPDGGGADE